MGPQVLRIGELDVHVSVSDRRRTVRLTVERDARITAIIPPQTDEEKLFKAISAKSQWIYAKLRERTQIGLPHPPREFLSGEGFLYLGRSYRLLLVKNLDRPVRLYQGRFQLREDLATEGTRQMIRWYQQTGEPWLRQRIMPWAQRMEIEIDQVRVLPLGYRWGSCTAANKINIHWATMQLDPDLIDYVLVHELAHVRHPSHDNAFWRAVERPMPDFHTRRARLRQTGPSLWLPDRM